VKPAQRPDGGSGVEADREWVRRGRVAAGGKSSRCQRPGGAAQHVLRRGC